MGFWRSQSVVSSSSLCAATSHPRVQIKLDCNVEGEGACSWSCQDVWRTVWAQISFKDILSCAMHKEWCFITFQQRVLEGLWLLTASYRVWPGWSISISHNSDDRVNLLTARQTQVIVVDSQMRQTSNVRWNITKPPLFKRYEWYSTQKWGT